MRLFLAFLVCCAPAAFAAETFAFQNKDRDIRGSFEIRDIGGAKTIVFSDDFSTKSGPDLKILLSPKPFAQITGNNATQGAVTLGLLKSTKGKQVYSVPDDVDLSQMKSLLIHCVKFSKLWGGAPLK